MIIGGKEFETNKHTYVMGILNVTPDSFSDGGKWLRKEHYLSHVEQMLTEGVDIIDIGGESTRPGYTQVSEEEEIARVAPVIEVIKAKFDVPISLDTYKSNVARAGIEAGADMINDIWGLKHDPQMAEVIAKSNVACCLMHNRNNMEYQDFLKEMLADLTESIDLAKATGIARDKIIIDPGIGFGKSYDNNMEVLGSLEKLHVLDYPILLGTSRKSVIGLTLDLPAEERLEGTLVTTVMAVLKGCAFVRVHDVQANVRAIRMAEAILQGGASLYGRDSY